jgi:hypothetical protein
MAKEVVAVAPVKPPFPADAPICGNCKAWRKSVSGRSGTCHHNAPAPVASGSGGEYRIAWPSVLDTEDCEQFKKA